MNERIQAVLEAVQELNNNTTQIKTYIPNQASAANQLADRAFVNSSISTATATFRGTFEDLDELQATDGNMNDYTFYKHTDSAGNTVFDRYKYIGSPEPRLPDEYQEVESINGVVGSAYIDTGVKIEPNMHIKLKFKSWSFSAYSSFVFFGANGPATYGLSHDQFTKQVRLFKGGDMQVIPEISSTEFNELEILSSGAVNLNGIFLFNVAEYRIDRFNDLSIYINAMNGQTLYGEANVTWRMLELNSSDETPKASYVPCYRKFDYVAGMYDLVTDTFKPSDGTAPFNYTELSTDKWEYEYTLNNSSFTSEQWAAINSGITAETLNTKENTSNKVTSLSAQSTDTQYPSAKAVYEETIKKQDKLSAVTQQSPTSITLADNTEYNLTEVSVLAMTITANIECRIFLTTASTGTPSFSFTGTRGYAGDSTDTIGNSEVWEFSVKNGYVIGKKWGATNA